MLLEANCSAACDSTSLGLRTRGHLLTALLICCAFPACTQAATDSNGAATQAATAGASAGMPNALPLAGEPAPAGNAPVTAGIGAFAPVTGTAGSRVAATGGMALPATSAPAPMHSMEDLMKMTGADEATMQAAQAQCKLQVTADPRDDSLMGEEPVTINVGFFQDTQLPQPVLDWMDEMQFAEAHDGWHLVRKWDQTCRKSNAEMCLAAQRLVDQGLHRAQIQQGAPGDGVAFMMMHRNMARLLRTAFPKHAKLFEGFQVVPRNTQDGENPQSWHQISWTSSNIQGFDILEHIEDHVDMFPTEDDLGQYIENTYRWTAESPTAPINTPGAGVHGALHSQWSVPGSPINLIDQSIDVKNFVFWKLHGWIDDVWERYRQARGLTEDDPSYKSLEFEQCMEMYLLEPRNRNMPAPGTTSSTPGAGDPTAESGEFATMVRPFLDNTCGGSCHGAMGPSAGLTLGGPGISTAEVIAGIVNQTASNGEYNLIEPGDPAKSWVYLKASGEVATAACTKMCNRQQMPPSGMKLAPEQLDALRQWIVNGATTK